MSQKTELIHQNASLDLTNHPLLWQSALDPTCANQWIYADWSNLGPFSMISFAILYGPLGFIFDGSKITHNVTLTNPTSGNIDASGMIACTLSSVNNSREMVRYDICSFQNFNGPPTVFDGMTGANFSFELAMHANASACQMNIYEVLHEWSFHEPIAGAGSSGTLTGNPAPSGNTSSSDLSAGAIAGIAIVSIIGLAVLSLFLIRQKNIQKRKRARRYLDLDSEWTGLRSHR
ncbi:hypothetical protein BCR33DRAFT_715960 [Rhizoclosmatium globosum]|uniref:Uncharacterized protein n=1 Tax=Rhizoclosmatium globosum TaxID=329046 RepID=A0A1Y2CHZ4_9FUNG|nr:hypothetical protein BCR33DRAFT_715960 [Rhizoclosmatium globosum]|eukprot:ORY45935.1 hypothetical protein BCR33DRAFT_715960 [Rhizoclosmatium globosum]